MATAEGDKVVGLFADRSMNKILEGRGDYLANATAKALELLDKNVEKNSREGFVLMVEGSKIDFRTHDHETEAILAEMRDFEKAIKVAKEYADARIFGDIGCYTLGALPPFRAIDSCVDMGASITMAKGAADAGVFPAIAVIGDSTFTHSGMTGLLDAINDNANITVVISDNLTTAMTGGQDSAGTNKFEAICLGLGLAPEHVRVVVPLPKNMEEITRTIREEIEYKGVSVIIPRRECMQTLQRKLRNKKK